MNRRGSVLLIIFMVIVVLTGLGGAMFLRAISENSLTRKYAESTQAFWLAEAGVSRALKELGDDFSASGTNAWSDTLGVGRYSIDVEQVDSQTRKVTSRGYVPADSPRVERIIEVMVDSGIPPDFYDEAIYSAGEIDLNGNSYNVTGNVRYADEIEYSQNNISGTITQDATISPLAVFDFQQLYDISQSQGNVYDEDRLQDVQRGGDSLPGDFWYSEPTDPADPTTGVPNVVYVECDLSLNGNIGTIGGFFVVLGDVLTDPDAAEDATVNGNGQIDGAIYARGEFSVNGGGGNLNVNGGVWAGEEAELNGNANITYNQDYMDAIEALNINPGVQISSWKDTQNPYILAP